MEHVLVGVDDSAAAREALEYALEQFPDASISAVHVPETSTFSLGADSSVTDEARERAERVLAEAEAIADRRGRSIETDVVFGHPAKALVSYADDEGVDGIVVGTRGADGARRALLGSTAETVVRRANCPVTVVR